MKFTHNAVSVARIALSHNLQEQVFHECWQVENAGGNVLERILGKGNVSQRDCTVAASIVQWLGSTCGEYFRKNARKYSAGWKGDPERLDNILSLEPGTRRRGRYDWPPSVRDRQVAEVITHWLDTTPGKKFIEGVDQEYLLILTGIGG